MKISILTDVHFGCRNNSKYFMQQQVDFFNNVFFPYIIEKDITTLFILGDTHDNRKTLEINVFNTFKEVFFDRLEKLNINVYMLIGNHDSFHKNNINVNSVSMYGEMYKNINVINDFKDVPFCINGTDTDYSTVDIGFCSWVTPESEQDFYRYLQNSKAKYLFGHFEISGFEMTKGHPCEDGIQKTIFSKFSAGVYSGHFHVRSTKDNITYVSNQIQLNWGDHGLDKGFGVIDISTGDFEYINNPVTIFEKITFSDAIDLLKFNYNYYTNKIVRVYILASDLKNKKFDLFLEKLSTVAHQFEVVPINNLEVNNLEVELNQDIDTKTLIFKYIEGLNVDNKQTYLQLLDNLYIEALTKISNDGA